MLQHSLPALLVAFMLGGCAGGSIVTKATESEISKLKAENNAIILFYTSLHDDEAAYVQATFARPDGKGRYVGWRGFMLKNRSESSGLPVQLKIPAGDYAIVELGSSRVTQQAFGRRVDNNEYRSQDPGVDIGSLHKAWDRPITTFKVEAGEVVDLGNIHVLQGPTQPGALLGLVPPKGSFAVKVGPMPEQVLKNLAERNPDLARARIVRTMVAPVQTQ